MEKLSTDELLTLLSVLSRHYEKTDITLVDGSNYLIVDDFGADLLRLILHCSNELVKRIDLPF